MSLINSVLQKISFYNGQSTGTLLSNPQEICYSKPPVSWECLIPEVSWKQISGFEGIDQVDNCFLIQSKNGASFPSHYHPNQDQFIFVISGQLTLIKSSGPKILFPGESTKIYAKSPHMTILHPDTVIMVFMVPNDHSDHPPTFVA